VTATETARPPQIAGYQYIADIATGGYSVVYRYRQRSPRRDVAVKVLTATDAPVAPEQREAEADMMAKLGNHPNIVQVIVADVTPDGRHYIIMPYYPGRSLAELVAEGQLAVGKVLRVGVYIAGALDAAHRLGLLHRDLKPGNILIDEYGMPRLTDFGIAGWVGPGPRADAGGMSIPWSPAEVVAGGANQRASDIYSLGATLFHLLTGQPPFSRQADTRESLEQRILTIDAPPTGRSDMPSTFEALLARMLARDPGRRPLSASAVAAELREIEEDLGGPASADAPWHSSGSAAALPERFVKTVIRPTPLIPAQPSADPGKAMGPTTVPEPARTRNAQWILIAAATLAVAVIAVGIVWSAHGSPAPRPSPSPIGSQNAAIEQPPPGPVTIVGHRSGSNITFTWSYDGADASDTFLWRLVGSSATKAVSQPTVTMHEKQHDRVCIQIKVVRVDGTYSGDWSAQGCVA
jgi:serine/threonine protein kinase